MTTKEITYENYLKLIEIIPEYLTIKKCNILDGKEVNLNDLSLDCGASRFSSPRVLYEGRYYHIDNLKVRIIIPDDIDSFPTFDEFNKR